MERKHGRASELDAASPKPAPSPSPPSASGKKKSRKEALFPENPELRDSINSFKEEITRNAERVMSTSLPEKILALKKLHQDLLTKADAVTAACVLPSDEEVNAAAAAAAAAAATAQPSPSASTSSSAPSSATPKPIIKIPCNTVLVEMINQVKAEALNVMEMLNTVKLWIQLSIPEVSDGGNFGVQIQEEIVEELGHSEEATYSFLDSSSSYFLGRATVASKLAKHVTVQDFRHTLRLLDLKFYYDVLFAVLEMRDNLTTIIDSFLKNEARIRNPRGSGGTQLGAMF